MRNIYIYIYIYDFEIRYTKTIFNVSYLENVHTTLADISTSFEEEMS